MVSADKEALSKGVRMLEAQGHLIVPHMKGGKLCWEIDCRISATGEEVERLAGGLYSFSELEEVCVKRRA